MRKYTIEELVIFVDLMRSSAKGDIVAVDFSSLKVKPEDLPDHLGDQLEDDSEDQDFPDLPEGDELRFDDDVDIDKLLKENKELGESLHISRVSNEKWAEAYRTATDENVNLKKLYVDVDKDLRLALEDINKLSSENEMLNVRIQFLKTAMEFPEFPKNDE